MVPQLAPQLVTILVPLLVLLMVQILVPLTYNFVTFMDNVKRIFEVPILILVLKLFHFGSTFSYNLLSHF